MLRLREDLSVDGYVGIKEELLLRQEAGEDLESCEFEKPLKLVRRGQLKFKAVA